MPRGCQRNDNNLNFHLLEQCPDEELDKNDSVVVVGAVRAVGNRCFPSRRRKPVSFSARDDMAHSLGFGVVFHESQAPPVSVA